MTWRALVFCAVLTTACSIPVPPREAFSDQNPDISGEDASEVSLDTTMDALDVSEVSLDTTTDTLDVSEVSLDTTMDALDMSEVSLDTTTDALDVSEVSLDTTMDALDASEVSLDDADSTLDAPDVDLCASVTCVDLPCATQACAPTTGKCVPTSKIDGWACDDGKKCTENDACASGVCTGTTKNCGDGNSCTNDSCTASLGCVNTVVMAGTTCDDGDACTVGDVCAGMTCAGSAKLFEKTFGDSSTLNVGWGIVATADGGFAVASALWGPKVAFGLIRTDAAGKQLWAQAFDLCPAGLGGCWGDVQPSALVQTNDGGFAIVGSAGGDGWVVRTDATGKKLWDKTYGGAGFDYLYSGLQTPDGGLVFAGMSSVKSADNYDAWLVRTDADGAVLWTRTYIGPQLDSVFDGANFVLQTADGGFALVGSTGWTNTPTKTDVLLIRTDGDGNLLWSRAFGGDGNQGARQARQMGDGGFAILGGTSSKGAGGHDLWFLRTDEAGNLLWDRTYGGGADDYGVGLVLVGDSGFALVGSTQSKGAGNSDGWLVRTDLSGNQLWDRTFGGTGNDGLAAIVDLGGSGFAVAGSIGPTSTESDMLLLRTDPWGNTSCATSGICSGYTNECDDSNPCTADLCDAAHSGCWHSNLPDTSPCSSGDACLVAQTCTAGACGGGGAKLFDTQFAGTMGTGGYLAIAPGGFVVAGSPKNVSTAGDVRIVRTDGAGALAWDKTYSLGSYDGSASAVVATSNGFAVAGSVGSDNNGEDCFLLTTDAAGKLALNAELGDKGDDYAYALAAVADGYALAGATMSLGATTQNGYLIRTDASGAQLWQKSYDGANVDAFNAIAALPDGFALAGLTASISASTGHAWLVRTDPSGVQLWAQSYAHGTFDAAHAVVATADGFILGGETTGSGASDMWLIRTDASGVKLWSQTFGTSAAESVTGLSMDSNGLALVGNSGGNGYVVRTDWDGNKLWDATVGAGNSQSFHAIAALSDGFAIAGNTNVTGSQSFWLHRTDLWGNASCAASGTCAALNVSDCDDSNPCTADLCNAAKSGCWHANMVDGTVCGNGATCAAGTCICAPGYLSVTSGDGKVCAADGPVWGNLPYSPAGFSDNADGTVSDTDTGLTWQQADPAGVTYTWDQANQFCITSKLANVTDWRLPTLAELSTLIDFNKLNPATTNLLQTNVSLGYWSATPLANGAGNAWSISFVVGDEAPAMLSSKNHVRCVRGTTASQTGKRFTTAVDTVTDTWTQLIWQRALDASAETPGSAQAYCASLVLDGSMGWRMPNIVELRSLVDRSVSSPAIDAVVFPATPSEWFWATSGAGGSSVNIWSVYFSEGKSEGNDKANTFRVRCVK